MFAHIDLSVFVVRSTTRGLRRLLMKVVTCFLAQTTTGSCCHHSCMMHCSAVAAVCSSSCFNWTDTFLMPFAMRMPFRFVIFANSCRAVLCQPVCSASPHFFLGCEAACRMSSSGSGNEWPALRTPCSTSFCEGQQQVGAMLDAAGLEQATGAAPCCE